MATMVMISCRSLLRCIQSFSERVAAINMARVNVTFLHFARNWLRRTRTQIVNPKSSHDGVVKDSALQHGHTEWPEDRGSAGRNGPHTINIGKQETYTAEFMALNPNSKIPVIVDPEGPDGKAITIFESGAILLYLAEKSGKFLSKDPHHKWETIQWLMFQMAGVGPMFGQFSHFERYAKDKCDHPYPVERYANEAKRLLGVIENRLQGREFLVDDGYSIADMATFPWIRSAKIYYEEKLEFHRFPKTSAWVDRCYARPASAKGTTVCQLPH